MLVTVHPYIQVPGQHDSLPTHVELCITVAGDVVIYVCCLRLLAPQIFSKMMLDLELRPGVGLGNFELGTLISLLSYLLILKYLCIGASLWAILDLLREDTARFPHVDVKFDQQQPAISPIILHIRPHVDLLFSPRGQRLHTISVRRLRQPPNSVVPTILTIRYALHEAGEMAVLSSPSVVLRRSNVNKVFGPTYPGEVLSFPGVWFAFDEEAAAPFSSSRSRTSSPPLPVAALGPDRNAEVKRIVVCQRSKDATNGSREVLVCPSMERELKCVTAEVKYCSYPLERNSMPST